jgi:hypothetical protein
MAKKQAQYGQPAIYNSTLPTLADGDSVGLNVDSRGRLITTATVSADTIDINVGGVSYAGIESTTMQNAAVAIGNGTSMDISGMESLVLYVSGITSATITVEGEFSSGNWNALTVKSMTSGQLSSTITANGLYIVSIPGLLNARARISTYTSGTITVVGTATAAGNHADVQNVGFRETLERHQRQHYKLSGR